MRPSRQFVGESRSPLVIVDDFSGDPDAVIDAAAALAPFPPAGNYYPGLRRVLSESDGAAWDYVTRTLRAAAPFIGGGFDVERFDLAEASFSMVTTAPDRLAGPQRMPHFDATDRDYLAVLHYLSDTPGTAFYRQRATRIEEVEPETAGAFVAAARRDALGAEGYIAASGPAFEQIAQVEGRRDRLIIYRGRLLHSGLIPGDMTFSDDPRTGRLTANFFLQAHRA